MKVLRITIVFVLLVPIAIGIMAGLVWRGLAGGFIYSNRVMSLLFD